MTIETQSSRRHRRSPLLALLAVAASTQVVRAQTPAAKFVDSARVEIERATQDMDLNRLDAVMVLLDRALVAFPDDAYLLHYRGYAAYRRVIGLTMSDGDDSKIGAAISQGLDDLAKSAKSLQWPETLALEACLNSFRIRREPGSGMTLGPLTGRLSGEASKLGPDNPRVALLQAELAERTPATMGGGAERAKALVARAVNLFQMDHPGPLAPAWGKDEAEALQRRLSK
jgi:hypothetical protein